MMIVQLTPLMQECLQNCSECHNVCLQTTASIDVVGKISADDLRLLLNCTESCRTCADFIDTLSPFHPQMCGLCEQVCIACSKMCRSHNIAVMTQCAEVCDRCADSCHRMAATGMHGMHM